MTTPARPRLGLLTNYLEQEISQQKWRGIADLAEARGADLFTFVGIAWSEISDDDVRALMVYDLATAKRLDGVIVHDVSVVSELPGRMTLEELSLRCAPLPVVSTEAVIAGTHAVLQDDYDSMRNAMLHLLDVHGYRRIGFVRGPTFHSGIQERYRAYVDAMTERGLFEPRHVTTPVRDWVDVQTRVADRVTELLGGHGHDVEAIVAASRSATIGTLRALESCGKNVPADVAVVGYDDWPLFRASTPTVTIVQTEFVLMGQVAAETLLSLVNNEKVGVVELIPAHLKVRESCGCPSPSIAAARLSSVVKQPADAYPQQTLADSLESQREAIATSLTAAMTARGADSIAGWQQRLIDSLLNDLLAPDDTASDFVNVLGEVLHHAVRDDLSAWQDAVSLLRRSVAPMLPPALASRAEDIYGRARVVISDMTQREAVRRELEGTDRAETLRATASAFAASIDFAQLMDTIAEHLPRIGIKAAYVSLYEHDETTARRAPESSRLMMAFDEAGRVALPAEGQLFRTRDILPDELLHSEVRMSRIVMQLAYQERQHGFIVFQESDADGALYESIRHQISSALEATLLASRLSERARDLEQANLAIEAGHEVLLHSEKMASLGRLTAGVAHEINTPLAASRSALMEIDRLAEELQASLADPAVTADDYREICAEMRRSIALSDKGLERVGGFVRGIKEQTRTESPEQRSRFNAVPVIRESLLLVRHALNRGNCTATFNADSEEMPLFGSPSQLAQIVTNLVTNAVDATGEFPGTITLELTRDGAGTHLTVHDDGGGIDEAVVPKIFDFLFTTKSVTQGTGMGLTIVHDIVVDTFGGSIDVQSAVGTGTTFTLHFPNHEGQQWRA